MEVAPTEEAVAALLDYLVDPMLPLRASGKDPPLETQEAVAKQMHAVVLLYNYYHRDQNPQLEFLEFGAFCKLAVSLKPALIAHMKYMQQADSTGSVDMENQLSVTEKAIKDACKISLALTSLKDVSNAEGWPVSKVAVLLVDSKKENCLLLFGPITNGVWSVIEKCLDTSDLPLEGSSKGKHSNKRKRKGGKVPTGEQSDGELPFQQIALSAVEEATGINQSKVTVLEKHVTYSLSEENMAANFYIMQCTQSSNEDIQIPIKDVIESLQGPLLKRTSNGWILTPKIEYYNVLPYARIMSGWLSREGVSACSEILNLSSSCEAEKNSELEATEIEKDKSIDLHNLIVELENVNSISSQGPGNPTDGEAQDNMGSIDGNCTGADSCGEEPTGADSSNRKEEVDDKEKPDKNSPEKPSDGEPSGADSSNRKDVDDKEKPDKCTPEKPSDWEVQGNRARIYGNCTGADSCDKEQTGAENSNRKEEVDSKEKPDKNSPEKPSDGEPSGADSSSRKEVDDKEKPDKRTPEKPSDREVQGYGGRIYGNCTGTDSCGKEQTGAENSDRKEEVDKEKPDKCSPEKPSNGEPSGADSSNRKEEVDDQKKPDNTTPEKPSDKEVQDKRYRDYSAADSCGKEPTGKESSNKEEIDDSEKSDKHSPEMCSDGEPTGADRYNRKRKEVDNSKKPNKCTRETPSDGVIQDNVGSIYGNCTGANSCSEEPIGADSFNKEEEVDDKEKPDKTCDITNSNNISFSNADAGALKMTSAEELQISPNFPSKRQKTDVDGVDIPCLRRGGKNRNASMPIRVYHHQKRKISVENAPGSSVAVTRCNMETSVSTESNGNELIDGKVAGICIQGSISSLNDIPAAHGALVPYDPNANVQKLQTVLVTKETEISDTALRVLLQKREEMCHQQRILEDKIALCSRDIQKIIDGDEDALALKLEAMIDCCNDMCLKGKTQIEGEIHQSEVQRTGECSRRNRLSDAILTSQSPCQELDDICHANNWRLPSYSVSVLTGGFVANVRMKEMGFNFSCEGAWLLTPHAARDSAAALMVAKLREL